MSVTESHSLRRQFQIHWSRFSREIIIGAFAIISINIAELILPVLIKDTVDSFSGNHFLPEHRDRLFWGLVGVVLLQVFGRYIWRVAISKSSMLTAAEFRKMFSRQAFGLRIPTLEKRRVGDLMTLATSDVENMRFALGPGVISVIDSIFYLITLPLVMFWLDPSIAWKVLLPVMMIPVVVYWIQQRFYLQSKKVQQQIGILGALTQEMVSAARLIKNYALETVIEQKLNRESRELNHRQVALLSGQAFLTPSMDFFLSTSMVILFASPHDSIGTLVAMQRYLQKLLWPLLASSMTVVYFQKARASGQEFFEFTDNPDQEPPSVSEVRSLLTFSNQKPILEATNLSFSYQPGKPVIQNLDFKIHPGEWVGIRGSVGSGKSTLFQLLLQFYSVERGRLFVEGKDICDYQPSQLRSYFSTVFQDPYIFQGSIVDNLNLGEEMHPLSWSMNVSGLGGEEFIQRMNQKLGERGTGLSGGQKQRLGIARAIRKKSPILLLDDPLSSVDQSTALKIIEEMNREIRPLGTTVLFISHHEEHLKWCDRILIL